MSPDEKIPLPHYTDSRFNYESGWPTLTVWGRKRADTFYNYDDRLHNAGDYDAARSAANGTTHVKGSINWWTVLLTHLHKAETLEMHHVLVGVNQGNGYPYIVFGYKYTSSHENSLFKSPTSNNSQGC